MGNPWLLMWIAIAGGVGSLIRYLGATTLTRWLGGTFPWGTLVVNVVGALAIGFLGQLALEAKLLNREVGLALTAGFLGGLTTFSSFAFEAEEMLTRREVGLALAYGAGSLILGVTMVWVGIRLGRMMG